MLYQLVNGNRGSLVERVRERASGRPASAAAAEELTVGLGSFLSQLSDLLFLRHADRETAARESGEERRQQMSRAAGLHGSRLQRQGFTLAEVVHDYSEIGRCIVELAAERGVQLSHDDFLLISQCVEAAVSGAITEHVSADVRARLGTLMGQEHAAANRVESVQAR